ncbi:MAG: OmpA family protein [Muribaculaceae bacterium]
MKLSKIAISTALCCTLILVHSSCSTMTNTGKGALIGGGGGAAVGAGIGAIIGGGKGAGIGSAIGAAVGAGAGALIGRKMDKQQQELQAALAEQATVEETTDQNGLQAIKVTFEGGILFDTGKYSISDQAKGNLAKFAQSLNSNPNTNVDIFGYTDNVGSFDVNDKLSRNRAGAVMSFLAERGVASSRMNAQGIPMADYVASNDTPEGRAKNRRVEIYITADQEMIRQAQAGTLQ